MRNNKTTVILTHDSDGRVDIGITGDTTIALGLVEFARARMINTIQKMTPGDKSPTCACGHAAVQHDAVGCVVTTDPTTNEHCPCQEFRPVEKGVDGEDDHEGS